MDNGSTLTFVVILLQVCMSVDHHGAISTQYVHVPQHTVANGIHSI